LISSHDLEREQECIKRKKEDADDDCASEHVAPAFSQSVVTEHAQGELAPQVVQLTRCAPERPMHALLNRAEAISKIVCQRSMDVAPMSLTIRSACAP
jgi:hypothetical protein